MKFKHRDIVEFTGRKGHVVGVVASGRMIERGRNVGMYTYKVAPLGKNGSFFEVPEVMLKSSKAKPSKAAIDDALEEQQDVAQSITQSRARKDERQRQMLEALNIQGGERVLIRGRGQGNWTAITKRVNRANGRVCIMSAGSRSGERWIDSTVIIKVVHEHKPAPVKLTERILDDLQEQGWSQVRYGREFIEQSYVVAFTPELALEGNDYEVASRVVNYDPTLSLYWRNTGSFD